VGFVTSDAPETVQPEFGRRWFGLWVGESAGCSVAHVASVPDFGGDDLFSCYPRTAVARVLTF